MEITKRFMNQLSRARRILDELRLGHTPLLETSDNGKNYSKYERSDAKVVPALRLDKLSDSIKVFLEDEVDRLEKEIKKIKMPT